MRAEAVVEAELVDGRTVLTRLRSEPPITLRRTGEGIVHQVGSGAGPIGGDDLALRVRVGPGASVTLRTVAAAVVLPGPLGRRSVVRLEADVAEGGHLAVLPEQQVLADGCDHEVHTHVRLGAGASLVWRDESVLGRTDEPGGSLLHRLRVDRDGRPVVRTDLTAGPRWPDSLGPAGLDGARCLGTLLLVAPTPNPTPNPHPTVSGPGSSTGGSTDPGQNSWGGGRVGVLDLGRGAVMVSALGPTASGVRAALDARAPMHALVHT